MNSHRVNRNININVALDLSNIHIRCVLSIRADAMVLLDQGIEYESKVLVAVPVSSVDATVLVVKFNSTSNSLRQSEARSPCHMTAKFCPNIRSYILGHQAVLGSYVGEWRSRSTCLDCTSTTLL